MFKYNKNAVFSGTADFLCLVCKDYLRSIQDVDVHIDKVVHKNNLCSNPYFEKYKEDYIRKINKNYYCQFCNALISTATKVELHVADTNHIDKKRSHLLNRLNNGVTADNEVFIDEKSWNGIINETCVLCDEEIEDEIQHTSSFNHLLNLVQKKVEFDVIKVIYRKIDNNTFHCLTCNVVFTSNTSIEDHCNDNHDKLYDKCSGLYQAISKTTEDIKDLTVDIPKNKESNNGGAKANEENKENTTKKNCEEESSAEINTPKEGTSKRSVETASKKAATSMPKKDYDVDICKILGATDYVTLDDHGNYYCILCDWIVKNRELHIESKHHKIILELHIKRMESTQSNDRKHKKPDADVIDKSNGNIEKESETNDASACTKNGSNTNNPETSVSTTPSNVPNGKMENVNGENALKGTRPKEASVSHLDAKSEEYAKKNHLSYNQDMNRVFCDICETVVPTALKSMKEHVSGGTHKNKADGKVKKTRPLKKQTLKQFIRNLTKIEDMFTEGFIINFKLFIDGLSFCCISEEQCFLCEKTNIDLSTHLTSMEHVSASNKALVIVSLESEFIRELPHHKYHCGFCNIVVTSWKKLESHLETPNHGKAKTASQWRLQSVLPKVLQATVIRDTSDFEIAQVNLFNRQ